MSETRRTLSPEHLEKLRAGREAARRPKEAGMTRGVEVRTPDAGPAPKPEPFMFPKPERMPDLEGSIPRLVKLAEVGEVLDYFWPLILRRYPDARREMVRPQLALATRGERMRLYRTDSGLALYEMRQTAWEPLSVIASTFVVGRDVLALLEAGLRWARETKAVRFDTDHPVEGGSEVATFRRDLRVIAVVG